MEKFKGLFKSRKFWAAVIGLVMLVVKQFVPDFPVEEGQLTNFVYIIVAYIMGVALEDGLMSSQSPANAPPHAGMTVQEWNRDPRRSRLPTDL